jgi:uroporphyrinogen decarboxylase
MNPTHRERLIACISNDASLDRPPVALWRHFPVDDQRPETLAKATLVFQRMFDFDLVKVTPASSYCLKDWGIEDVWEGHIEGTRRYIQPVIRTHRDWEALPVLDPKKARFLSDQLTCLRLIRAGLSQETPILQTIFSPLAQAKNLVGGKMLSTHIRQFPESVLKGLAIITESTRRFIEASIDTGIDGIFFAIQHAQAEALSQGEYELFGLPNDLKTLEPARSLWCNLLHLHGQDVYFGLISSLASLFPIVNWHDRESPPSLIEAQGMISGTVCGGISQKTIVYEDNFNVRSEAHDAILQTGGRRFVLGTGCVVPVVAPYGNIMAARLSVEEDR